MKGWNEARRVCLDSMRRGRNKKGVFKNKDTYILSLPLIIL